ncbi:MAG TPA: hypothetical protein PLT87_03760 [Spirochaetales bacterium]|nr:hypothetical protein [Spirochaetales bacterium]
MGSGLGFSIYKRKGSKKLQMQFRDNNRFAIQKSSGTTNRLEATRLAIEWKEKGLPQENGKPPRPVAEQIAAEALIYSVSTAQFLVQNLPKTMPRGSLTFSVPVGLWKSMRG